MARTFHLWLGALLATSGLNAAQFLVVSHPVGKGWAVEPVEAVQINGKEKVRSSAVVANRPAAWDAKSVGHLPDVSLATISILRRSPDGNVWGKAGAGNEWMLLLPDGVKAKAPTPAATLWKEASITLRKEKGDKTTAAIRSEDLYAVLPGIDPAASASRLSIEVALHKSPGVSDDDAFRSSVEITPEVVKAFPMGAATANVREHIRAEMASRLQTWTRGDAAITVLDEGLLLAGASDSAFPQSDVHKLLSDQLKMARQQLDRHIAILKALDAGKRSDAFLVAYRDFEPFDKSFRDLAQARRKHLEASAFSHLDEAKRLRTSGDYVGAIRHLRTARLRSPELADAERLLEQVRLEVARLSSAQVAEARRGIDPRSATQVQVDRRLKLAEQYIADSKAPEAEKALQEAETIDRDEPHIKLVEAQLAVVRGDLGLALALLDLYAGMAIGPQDFAEGEKLRASVQYKIESMRADTRKQLTSLFSRQRFATALTSAADGLKIDNEDPAFLYHAGVNACLLRHCGDAIPLLRRFLELTDSTTGNREQRIASIRLLQRATQPAKAAMPAPKNVETSWFSGARLGPGVYYDPDSLAFQSKVKGITASDHLTVNYEWTGNTLRSVHTRHEEKKTAGNIGRLALGIGMAAGGSSNSVMWKTAERETNDFYFNYYEDSPQVFNVSRDNQVVKSRTIPIMIPGMSVFGAFGGLGALGSLGSMGSMASMQGMGVSRWSGLMASASSLKRPAGLAGAPGAGVGGANLLSAGGKSSSYSIHGDPQVGASNGYLTLWDNPRLDTELAYMVTGKRVAVGFSGNHFFHPFVWDGLHMFEFDYDAEGRVQHAWEMDQPNPPRLDFAWEGRRLLSITAHDATPEANTVYSRTLNYSENRLLGEAITSGGKTSHIRYKYDKQGRLTEAECTDDTSLDGRSRKAEFLIEGGEKAK